MCSRWGTHFRLRGWEGGRSGCEPPHTRRNPSVPGGSQRGHRLAPSRQSEYRIGGNHGQCPADDQRWSRARICRTRGHIPCNWRAGNSFTNFESPGLHRVASRGHASDISCKSLEKALLVARGSPGLIDSSIARSKKSSISRLAALGCVDEFIRRR